MLKDIIYHIKRNFHKYSSQYMYIRQRTNNLDKNEDELKVHDLDEYRTYIYLCTY